MKRSFWFLTLGLALALSVCAQEPKNEAKTETAEHDDMLGWKWANFGILAFGLGFLVAKNLPPILKARTVEIQSGMREAAKMKAEAQATVAEVEKKLASVSADVDKLRAQLKSEMAAEEMRIQQDTERMAQRIAHQSEQDIASLTKVGRTELKAYSAALALDLAKQRVQAAMNPATQQSLVNDCVHDLRVAEERHATQGAQPQ